MHMRPVSFKTENKNLLHTGCVRSFDLCVEFIFKVGDTFSVANINLKMKIYKQLFEDRVYPIPTYTG